jgi:excisionase family DNA binding protein
MQKKKSGRAPRAEYLGVEQAAALTSMSIWFWRRKAYNGTVSSVKIGRRLLIPRTEIERLVTENTRPRIATSVGTEAATTAKPVELD